MAEPIALVRHDPNKDLIAELERMLEQAKSGEITGIAGIKLRPDDRFACFRIGHCSDLELAGAMAFATHDLIAGNPSVDE